MASSALRQLKAAAGQTLVVGFDGTTLPDSVSSALGDSRLGGVILFARNISADDETLHKVAALNQAVEEAVGDGLPRPFIAVDQEGGRVRRLRHRVTDIPAMALVGQARNADMAAQVSEVLATEVSALGFNLNFAPVLDVLTNPDNDVIGDRSFSSDPRVVANMAGAFAVGHYIAGVVPCGKHFPGHGDTFADSHLELPVVNHGLQRLRSVELLPFVMAIKAGLPMLMTAHLLIPEIDPDHPMTLSKHGLTNLLRDELKFEGVVVSDDLEMKAVADRYSIEEAVELGLGAGIDMFLICHQEHKWQRAHEHLVRLAERNSAFKQRLLDAARRIADVKQRYLPKAKYTAPASFGDVIATDAHKAVVADLIRRASQS
jgi:beta-N-acetylhexosaminidase